MSYKLQKKKCLTLHKLRTDWTVVVQEAFHFQPPKSKIYTALLSNCACSIPYFILHVAFISFVYVYNSMHHYLMAKYMSSIRSHITTDIYLLFLDKILVDPIAYVHTSHHVFKDILSTSYPITQSFVYICCQ